MSVTGQAYAINWNSDLPVTVPAGRTYNLSLSFTPPAKGALPGQLVVTSNSTGSGTLVIGLNGTGTDTASTTPSLSSLTCTTDTYTGSGVDDCSVTLSAAAPAGGFVVTLSSDNAAVTVPATVTIPSGTTSAAFTASIAPVSATQTATLTANAGSVKVLHALKLNGSQSSTSSTVLTALSCTGSAYTGAGTDNCTVTLSATAPTSGFAVSLASNNAAVTVPNTVNISAGSSSAVFTATVATVSSPQTATLTATDGGTSKSFALQLNAVAQTGGSAPVLRTLSCSSSSLTGANTDSCNVTVTTTAGPGGFAVSLTSNSTAVLVPATVTVPAGATSAAFTATASAVTSIQPVTLTASAAGATATFVIQLNAATASLSINGTSLAFGSVALNTPATQSITLTSTGALPVTVNAAAVTGSGFTLTGSTFPVTLPPGQTITLNVQFNPTVSGATTGTLTIVSTSATNPTATISLTGTGASASHEVDLSWAAPASSPDPVAGYYVYRATAGSTSYSQLNASVVAQTAYVDSNVTSGQTYDYVVKSVGASGSTSAPSNIATVAIP